MEISKETFWGLLLHHHEANIQSFLNVNDKQLKVMGILIYIQDHFQTLTLKKAADYFSFSPSHFSKMVKESTGQSFIQIIKGIKLEKACELLKETNLTQGTVGLQQIEGVEILPKADNQKT